MPPRRLVLLLILMAVTGRSSATAQIPDEIRFEGRTEMLFSEPLNAFLLQGSNLDRLRPYLRDRCTGSWRGYQATWEIRGTDLYLVALVTDPCNSTPNSVPLQQLFPGPTAAVPATWYSGLLVVPLGKRIQYVHMGYDSRYERYLIFEVLGGRVISRKEQDAPPPRQ
jgi:hypothetical protein